MSSILENPMIQYGAMGLAFVLTLAFMRAFFILLSQRQKMQDDLFTHHNDREKAFTEQFLSCVDRNSAALEKVEQSLQKIRVELARRDSHRGDTLFV